MNDIEIARARRAALAAQAEAERPHVVARVVCRACNHGGEGTPVYSVHPATADPARLECGRCHALDSLTTPLYWCDGCGAYLGLDPNVEHHH